MLHSLTNSYLAASGLLSRLATPNGSFPSQRATVPLCLDLTEPRSFPAVLAHVEQTLGPVDVLVNNARYGLLGAVEETDEDERRLIMETNFFGPAELTRFLLEGFRTPTARRRRSMFPR